MNKIEKYIIAVIVLVAVGAIGTAVYFGVSNVNEEKINDNNKNYSEQIEKNIYYQYNLANRSRAQGVQYRYIEIVVDTDGNAYLTLNENLEYVDDEMLKNNLLELQNDFKNYFPENYVSEGGEKDLNAYKLDIEKVLTAYYVEVGNGEEGCFVFVKENGTLSYIKIDELFYEGKLNLKDINGLENVIFVVNNTLTKVPYAVKLDGTEVPLYNYINET
ncbi:MAG: hypothetical protein IJA94_04350 [Bacilli bacterium]|nr:hypothetical protein [Bacilli bacterium]